MKIDRLKREQISKFFNFICMLSLTWFITISICLFLAVMWKQNNFEDGVPVLMSNLWEITLLITPVYLIKVLIWGHCDRSVIVASAIVLLLSMNFRLCHFPHLESITFINDMIMEEADSDFTEPEIGGFMLDLPDEL